MAENDINNVENGEQPAGSGNSPSAEVTENTTPEEVTENTTPEGVKDSTQLKEETVSTPEEIKNEETSNEEEEVLSSEEKPAEVQEDAEEKNSDYPMTVVNNVSIKDGDEVIDKRNQNLSMIDDSSNIIFDFSQKVNGEKSSVMSVYKNGEKKYVNISAISRFIASGGKTLEENTELKTIFESGGLEIGNNAIDVSQSGEEITIEIQSEDNKPYKIKVVPTGISLQYGDSENGQSYSLENKNSDCIDITMQRSAVEEMLKSDGENSIFKQSSSISKVPSTIVGLYLKGMENNTSIELGNYSLSRCSFSKDGVPYCFIKEHKPGTKTMEETVLFSNGRYVKCSDSMLTQYRMVGGKKQHNLVIASSSKNNPKYYAIPIKTNSEGKVDKEFIDAYNIMSENTTLEQNALLTNGEEIDFVSENEDDAVTLRSHKKDERRYSKHTFVVKSKNYNVYQKSSPAVYQEQEEQVSGEQSTQQSGGYMADYYNSSVLDEYSSTTTLDANSTPQPSGYNFVQNEEQGPTSVVEQEQQTSDNENENPSDENEQDSPNNETEQENPSSETEQENPSSETEQEISADENEDVAPYEPEDEQDTGSSYQEVSQPSSQTTQQSQPGSQRNVPPISPQQNEQAETDDSPNGEQGGGENEQEPSGQPQQDSQGSTQTGQPAGNGGNANSAQPASQQAQPEPRKHINPYVARAEDYKRNAKADKDELKRKNDNFKRGLRTFNTAMGDTLSASGLWLMVVAMIPGIGLATLIPGIIMTSIGLFQSTFADKLVFNPYRKIRRKLKDYEEEQVEEFESRDKFLENERELDRLAVISNEKINQLDSLFSERGGNEFAREFAKMYNENGVGFARSIGKSGFEQLKTIDNLDNRVQMTNMLNQISRERGQKSRERLINNFANTYFQDLDETKRKQLSDMFKPENSEGLKNLVSTLNSANKAQSDEKAIINKQREEIKGADMYRLRYFASTMALSEGQRERLFTRYGDDVAQNLMVNHNSSPKVLDELLSKVPEAERENITNIMYDSVKNLHAKNEAISHEAEDNANRQKGIKTLREYANAVEKMETGQFSSFTDVSRSTEDYLNSYTLNYYNGYASKLVSDIDNPLVRDNSALSSKYGTDENNRSIIINNNLNNMLNTLSLNSETNNSLSQIQRENLVHLKNSGLFNEVAKIYSTRDSDGAKIAGGGSIVPNLSRSHCVKSNTLPEIAKRVIKEKLLDILENNYHQSRKELSKKSLDEIIRDCNVSISDDEASPTVSIMGRDYLTRETANLWHALKFVEGENKFKDEKNNTILDFITPELVNAVAREDTVEPLVTYDNETHEYKVLKFNSEKQLQNAFDDNYDRYPASMMEERFSKKFPIFKNLKTFDQRRNFIMLSLGIEAQKQSLEYQRQKDITDKTFDEKAYEANVAVIEKLDKTFKSILSGKFSTALDDVSYSKSLNGQGRYSPTPANLKNKGKNLNKKLSQYASYERTIESLPLTTDEKQEIRENAGEQMRERKLSPGYALRNAIKPYLKQTSIDGKTVNEIFNEVFSDGKINRNAFNSYCQEKSKTFNERSQRNLVSTKDALGGSQVQKDFDSAKADALKNKKTYKNYSEFFSEVGYNNEAGTSKLFPGLSKEEHDAVINAIFSSAKTPRQEQKTVDALVKKMGMAKEYKQAKKDITPTGAEGQRRYDQASMDYQNFVQARDKAETTYDLVVSQNNLSYEEFIKNLSKEDLNALGMDKKTVRVILKDDKKTQDQKREELQEYKNSAEIKVQAQEASLQQNVVVQEYASTGLNKAEVEARQAIAKANFISQQAESLSDNLGNVANYIKSHPEVDGKALATALASDNQDYFDRHPEVNREQFTLTSADREQLEIFNIDVMNKNLNNSSLGEKLTQHTKQATEKMIDLSEKEMKNYQKQMEKAEDESSKNSSDKQDKSKENNQNTSKGLNNMLTQLATKVDKDTLKKSIDDAVKATVNSAFQARVQQKLEAKKRELEDAEQYIQDGAQKQAVQSIIDDLDKALKENAQNKNAQNQNKNAQQQNQNQNAQNQINQQQNSAEHE